MISIYSMLTHIKNGLLVNKKFVYYPKNKICLKVLHILYEEGYILHYHIENRRIKIFLKYVNQISVIKKIVFSSKKQNPIYISLKKLWKIDSSFKLYILFTNKGILSSKKSKKLKVGGKLLAIIE